MSGRPWLQSEDDIVKSILHSGGTYEDCAKALLGRSVRACNVHATRYKLSPRSGTRHLTTDEERKVVVKMFQKGGVLDMDVVRATGLHKGVVARIRRDAGISTLSTSEIKRRGTLRRYQNDKGRRRPTDAILLSILSDGPKRLRDIHATYGRGHRNSLCKHLRKMRTDCLVFCEGVTCTHSTTWQSVFWWLSAHEGLLHKFAYRIKKKSPHLDVEDIYSQLKVEVVNCVKYFRPRGVKFSTYAVNIAFKTVSVWAANERVKGIKIACHMLKDTHREYTYEPLFFDRERGNSDGSRERTMLPLRDLPDAPPVDPTFWDQAVEGLTSRDRDLILWYYRDRKCLRKIGEVIGVTKERVRQLLIKARGRIKRSGSLAQYDQSVSDDDLVPVG